MPKKREFPKRSIHEAGEQLRLCDPDLLKRVSSNTVGRDMGSVGASSARDKGRGTEAAQSPNPPNDDDYYIQRWNHKGPRGFFNWKHDIQPRILNQFNKWVFVDGQWGAIAEVNGIPLNAVEFQDAIVRKTPSLKIRFVSECDKENYINWIIPYLYYLDFNADQRFYAKDYKSGKIMLVPKGAKKPKVFQRKFPIKNCRYISNPKAFYPQMNR